MIFVKEAKLINIFYSTFLESTGVVKLIVATNVAIFVVKSAFVSGGMCHPAKANHEGVLLHHSTHRTGWILILW